MPSVHFNTLCQPATLFTAWNTVKAKGAAGGVDGMTVEEFEKQKKTRIPKLAEEVKSGSWKPLPYLQIEVPKKKNTEEMRKLGMTAICDKIVQQAIKMLIEPRLEKQFKGNSYAFRPGKGATKAIRRVVAECAAKKYQYVLRLDIDDFFDNIDRTILQQRLTAIGIDAEVVRLIMLSVEMGQVRQGSQEWREEQKGIPQGALLSPLLSNLYLNSFDQFAVSCQWPYIRYADDFLFLCETVEQATDLQKRVETHLREKLHLALNEPKIYHLCDGFDFLGVHIQEGVVSVSPQKKEELIQRIHSLEFTSEGMTRKSAKTWEGMSQYYARILPQKDLEDFDRAVLDRLTLLLREHIELFPSRSALHFVINTIPFLSVEFASQRKTHIAELAAIYLNQRNQQRLAAGTLKNKRIIRQRKLEYRKKEVEASSLLVNKPGTFIGLGNRGVTVYEKGKVIAQHHADNLSQIVVTGNGVSMSSNLLSFCMSRKIPVDFFDHQGTHIGSIVTAKYIEGSLWKKQTTAAESVRNVIALAIIEGKIKNQHGLLKYFHKYHKANDPQLADKMQAMEETVEQFKGFKKTVALDSSDFTMKLMGHEAQVAIRYWDYIRELIADDDVGFERREHQGATDLVNSMLNYGYAILYVRVWQALLAAHLNPFDSLIHARQSGKPTLVYDMVEIFRSQVVDRVVISLIQKGQDLAVRNGLLTDKTRQQLVKSVMERLARYEKFQGEEMRMEQIILRQAKLLAKAFEGTEAFKPYVAKW